MAELKLWEEIVSTGEVVGKDPRKMTQAEFREIGHRAMSPIEVIRARCLDCCAGSVAEVRYCTVRKCPSWPFRMGTSPWRAKRQVTEEDRQRLAQQLAVARENKRVPVT